MAGTCPADCCTHLHLGLERAEDGTLRPMTLDLIAERINENLIAKTGTELDQGAEIFAMLRDEPGGTFSCDRFDRARRACSDYANRPRMCSLFPNYGSNAACEHCTFDLRLPDWPGVRYAPIEETGIFGHDKQPAMAERLERAS